MLGWETMSDEQAVAAAIEEHGEFDARLSVAYAGLTAKFDGDTAEATIWFGVFMRLHKRIETT